MTPRPFSWRRYWLNAGLGLAAIAAALLLGTWSWYGIVQGGSCSSDPDEGLPPCPPETTIKGLLLLGAIALLLTGLALWRRRGVEARGGVWLQAVVWVVGLLLLTAANVVGAFGPGSDDGWRVAAVILAVIFVPMALTNTRVLRSATAQA